MDKLQVLKIIKEYLMDYDREYRGFEISADKDKQTICIKNKKVI